MFSISLSLLIMFMDLYYFDCMFTPYFCVGCLYSCVVQILNMKNFRSCKSRRMTWSLTCQLFIAIGSLLFVNALIIYVALGNWGFFLFSDFIFEFMLEFSLTVKMMWLYFELIFAPLFLIKLKYFWNDENVWNLHMFKY